MIPNSKTTLAVLWMTARRLILHIIMLIKALLELKAIQMVQRMEMKEKMARSGPEENDKINTNTIILRISNHSMF